MLPVLITFLFWRPELFHISEGCLAFQGGETKILCHSNADIGPKRKERLILSMAMGPLHEYQQALQ